jgi:hypothetical protein
VATQHVASAFVPGVRRSAPLPTVVLENSRAKIKKGEYSARSVEIRSSANERRPCAPAGLRDRSRRRRRSASLRSPSKFFRLQRQTFPNFCSSNAKFFQRFFWRLCGISNGCVRSYPENRKIDPPNFVLQLGSKSRPPAQSTRQAAERVVCTLTGVSAFRKKCRLFFVQRGNAPQAASCEPATNGIRKSYEQRLIHPARATERMPASAAGSERRRGFRPARLNLRSTRLFSGASQRACGLKSHASFPRRRRPDSLD